MTEKRDKLFGEFPPVSTKAWEEKVREDMKGADCEKKLTWNTFEGFTIRPYYRSEDTVSFGYQQSSPGSFPFVRGIKVSDNNWCIRQQVMVEDISDANRKALEMIEKGVTSLEFVFSERVKMSRPAFDMLLQNFPLGPVEINFSGYGCETSAEMLEQYCRDRDPDKKTLKGSVNFDPLGRLCKKGHYTFDSEEQSIKMLVSLIKDSSGLPGFRTIGVNACNFGNAGASVVQELAFGLAMGAEYLAVLTDEGLTVKEIAAKTAFHFAVSPDYFMEIAKYRAARFLWAKIVEAFNPVCDEPMYIHAETTRWNLSVYNAYMNMLRTATEGMSAILAGVDALTVLPFDITFEKPTAFAERIARNQQIILKEEAYFDRVIDPAAGSYYIENLTESIIGEAWKLFITVQQQGGFVASLKQGFIQQQVEETARLRDLAIATRKEFIIGTNQFPDFEEFCSQKPVDFTIECCGTGDKEERIIQPIRLYRGTRDFEKLRLKTDLGGRRPRVFMLTIGNLSMRLARSQFSCNFFACAGYEVIDNIGFGTVDEGIGAAVKAKADVVVLCSSDDEYAVYAPEAYEKIKDRAILVVAGAPPCMEELKTKGIENFVHIRSNVLDTLTEFHQKLGIL